MEQAKVISKKFKNEINALRVEIANQTTKRTVKVDEACVSLV